MLELESETSDGGVPTESTIETSEATGDTIGISIIPECDGMRMVFGACETEPTVRSKCKWSSLSSSDSGLPRRPVSRQTLIRCRRFMLPFHQFFTALSLLPRKRRAISAQRLPISPTSLSINAPSSGVMGSWFNDGFKF